MEYKFCPNCGFKLNGDFKFCPDCGFSFNIKNINEENNKNIENLDKLFSDKIKNNEDEKKQLEDNLKKAKYYLYKEMYNEAITCYKQLIMQDRYNYDYYIGLLTAYTKNFETFEDKTIDKLYQIILKLFPNKKDDESIVKYNQNKEKHLEKSQYQKEQEIANQEAKQNAILARHNIIIQGNKVFFGHSKKYHISSVEKSYKTYVFKGSNDEFYLHDDDELYSTRLIEWDVIEKRKGYYLLMSHDYISAERITDIIGNTQKIYDSVGHKLIERFFTEEEQKALYRGIDCEKKYSVLYPNKDDNKTCAMISIPTRLDYFLHYRNISFSGELNSCIKCTSKNYDSSLTFFRNSRNNDGNYYGTPIGNYLEKKIISNYFYPIKITICIDTNKYLNETKQDANNFNI